MGGSTLHRPHVKGVDGCVVGFDPSLRSTGVATLLHDVMHTWTLQPRGLKGVERLSWYRDSIRTVLDTWRPRTVVVEGYAFGKNNRSHHMGELGGVVRLSAWDSGASVYVVPPATLKKFVVAGNATKEQVSRSLYARWGVDTTQPDEADAAALTLMGAYREQIMTTELTRASVEAVDTMELVKKRFRVRTRNLQPVANSS